MLQKMAIDTDFSEFGAHIETGKAQPFWIVRIDDTTPPTLRCTRCRAVWAPEMFPDEMQKHLDCHPDTGAAAGRTLVRQRAQAEICKVGDHIDPHLTAEARAFAQLRVANLMMDCDDCEPGIRMIHRVQFFGRRVTLCADLTPHPADCKDLAEVLNFLVAEGVAIHGLLEEAVLVPLLRFPHEPPQALLLLYVCCSINKDEANALLQKNMIAPCCIEEGQQP